MVRMPSYVIFGVFPRAMHVINGESQPLKTKEVSNSPCHRKKVIAGKQDLKLRNRRQI